MQVSCKTNINDIQLLGSCRGTALPRHEPFFVMTKKIDDNEWSHSTDDGSGYSNDGDNRVR